MNPTENDVLSGRGAWFNQHPGNKHFRRMLEEQKAVYMAGTKKQKMDISKAIVEAIYSMKPPGRFLKKCPDTGQWSELSKRDAADRTAQAMAYAIKGESLKQKRKDRRSRRQDDDGGTKSSQSADRPINNPSEGNNSPSSVARRRLTPRRGEAAGTNNNDVPQSASELLLPPGNSNVQQQLLQQLQQLHSTTTLPTTLGNSQNVNQNALAQLLSQPLQQQQLSLQYLLGQNQLGLLQSQTPLQPASIEGLTQMLAQAQQQHNDQQQVLLQRLLNHQQNVLPSASLPASISVSAPFLTGNLLQNLQQQSNTPSNALLLSSMLNNFHQQSNPNAGISNSPHETTQQMDQLQRSLMLQQNQLLASSLGASSSNNQLPLFQQQTLQQQFDPFLQQTLQATLQLQQNSQGLPPPPINSAGLLTSANVAPQSSDTGQKGSEDAVQNEPEKDD
mmetsp:Transcript_18926/g.28558  ORF Transcript_18926/g.28558 Transcript_18926/m.28558 type:complete len:446 (+) Transcript_18926:178-1515(+)